ncbi:MAG: signal peptidase II [Cypionkella sp.]|nr:signal peptidase II [Cypionkella sp.]
MTRALSVAFVVFLADQASKWFVLLHLNLAQVYEIDVLPPYLNLRMAWNYGVNFGLLAADNPATRWALITVALVICAGVLIWLRRAHLPPLPQFAAGLLIGGALGNVIDRILYGAVADFLNMSCCGIRNPFSFNIADICVFAGAIGLAFFADPHSKKAP